MPSGQSLRLAAFGGQFPGQLPDDLRHQEARFRFAGCAPDQAVIAQLLQRRQNLGAQVRAADRLDLGEARAAGEDRKAAEQAARRGPQQVVAPEDRRAQGLLPGRQVPGASGQEGQAGAEAGQQGGGREKADPRRGQFQGQGQPVQAADDPGHRGRVFRGQMETGADRLGPGHEQGHRLAGFNGGFRWSLRRQAQRGHRELPLSVQAQGGAGGDQQVQARSLAQPLRGLGAGLQELLEVVQDQQQAPGPQVLAQPFAGVPLRRGQAQGGRHGRGQQAGIAQPLQRHEVHAVREGGRRLRGRAQGQAGLARAPRPGEGQQPAAGKLLQHAGQLAPPADEGGERHRQAHRRGAQGARRREVPVQAGSGQLEQQLRLVEVLQPVGPQLAQAQLRADAGTGQPGAGGGDQHLPAVGGRGDAGRPVHVQAQVAVPAQEPLAAVQADAHAQGGPRGPAFRRQEALGFRGRAQSGRRRGEHVEQAVPAFSRLHPLAQGPAQQRGLPLHHRAVPVAQPLDQPGGAFHVGEQEGHRAGWKPRAASRFHPAPPGGPGAARCPWVRCP